MLFGAAKMLARHAACLVAPASVAASTVEAATRSAMEARATAVSTSTVEIAASIATTAAIAVAAVEVPTAIAAIKAASVAAAAVITVSATAVIPAAIAVSATIVAAPVIAVIPGAGADEDAADEPVRAVVSIRGAGVWIVVVVAIFADWRGTVINRSSNSDAEGDALGVGVGS